MGMDGYYYILYLNVLLFFFLGDKVFYCGWEPSIVVIETTCQVILGLTPAVYLSLLSSPVFFFLVSLSGSSKEREEEKQPLTEGTLSFGQGLGWKPKRDGLIIVCPLFLSCW